MAYHTTFISELESSLCYCLINTLTLWWVDACLFCFLCKYPMAFWVLSVSCFVFGKLLLYLFINFHELILDISKKTQRFSSETLSSQFSEVCQSCGFSSLCVCWCQMTPHPVFPAFSTKSLSVKIWYLYQ